LRQIATPGCASVAMTNWVLLESLNPDSSKATEGLARPVAATKSEARNPKSETNPNHRNSKLETNHNVLFLRWLCQLDSNIKHKKQEVEGL
jgi:hypothetical protein